MYPDYHNLIPEFELPELHCYHPKEQAVLLQQVMEQTEEAGEDEILTTGIDDLSVVSKKRKEGKPFKPLTAEEKVKREKDKEKAKKRHTLFKQWKS